MARENAVQRLIRDARDANPGLRYQDIADRSGMRQDGTGTVLIRSVVQNWASQETWERSPSREAMDGLARGLGLPPSCVRAAFGEVLGMRDPIPESQRHTVAHQLADRVDALGSEAKGRVLWALERMVDAAAALESPPPADPGASVAEIFDVIRRISDEERAAMAAVLRAEYSDLFS